MSPATGGTRDAVAVTIGTVRELVSRSLAQLRSAGAIDVMGWAVVCDCGTRRLGLP